MDDAKFKDFSEAEANQSPPYLKAWLVGYVLRIQGGFDPLYDKAVESLIKELKEAGYKSPAEQEEWQADFTHQMAEKFEERTKGYIKVEPVRLEVLTKEYLASSALDYGIALVDGEQVYQFTEAILRATIAKNEAKGQLYRKAE